MLSQYALERLARLTEQRSRGDPARGPASAVTAGLADPAPDPPDRADAAVVHRVPAGREAGDAAGSYWLIEAPLDRLWPAWPRLEASAARTGRSLPAHPELRALAEHFPQATLLFDLETCGFAGSPLFLIGTVHRVAGRLVVRQALARHYAEEPALVRAFWRQLAGQRVLVSFNGKSFDLPMLRDRTIVHRLDEAEPAGLLHCDLLHHARRRWGKQLPDCKLQTLERTICGRHRRGDLAGARVPQAYHRYVRTGDDRELQAVLHHNLLDLVTLLQLAMKLRAGFAD